MKLYDVIIIGGGPAGYSAALYASRAGLSCAVIESISPGGQLALTDVIDNYPGFEEGIDGFTLGMKMQSTAERFGAETIYAEVTEVELEGAVKTVRSTDGEYHSRTVVIATGASPKKLGAAGEDALLSKGVHYCAHCDGRFYKGKTVAVVGGGNSAVGDALYLSRLCEKVYLIHRRDELRATKIYRDKLPEVSNIEFIPFSVVSEVKGEARLQSVTVKNVTDGSVQDLHLDGLFISIGRTPTTEILKGKLELDPFGYVIAEENTETSVPGVFAAGDVRTKQLRQVVTAVSDGAVAATMAEEYITKTAL